MAHQMTQLEGLTHAKENGFFDKHDLMDTEFYKLFKLITKMVDINPCCKLVLTMILSYEMEGKKFFATNGKISEEMGITIDMVKKALNTLKGAGYVKIYKISRKDTYLYRQIETQTFEVSRGMDEADAEYTKTEV